MTTIVVGGGIAGAVTALALHRAGIKATIYESYPDAPDDTGGLLSLAANGVRALRLLDCLAVLDEVAVPVPDMQVWAPTGRPVGRAPRQGSNLSDIPGVAVLRGALSAALRAEAERRGVTVRGGARLVAAETGPDGVLAGFADGTEASGSVLVGADGVHSRVRRIIDPDAPGPEYAGVYVLGGTAEGVSLPRATGTFHAVMAERGMFAFVAAGPDRWWWTAQVQAPTRPDADAMAAMCSPALAEHYAGEPAALIRATARFHPPTVMNVMAAVPTWHRQRLVAVGDAVHPVDSGIGAALAVEDGLELARCLRDVPDPVAALARFEALRRPRIDPLVRFGSRNKRSKTPGPVARWFRRTTMPVLMPLAMRMAGTRFAGRMFTYDVDWDAPVAEPTTSLR